MQPSHNSPFNEVGTYLMSKWQQYLAITRHTNRETLEVFQVFGFIARIYEKIRASVENKGEQVIRRFAIERALKRPDALSQTVENRAERLIRELTWSRFLPNNYVTREQFGELVEVIRKYHKLGGILREQNLADPKTNDLIFSIESAEIEELLVPSLARQCLVPTFSLWVKKTFKFQSDTPMPEEELDMQIYLAAHRAIAKSDAPILYYSVLTLMFPQWNHAEDALIRQVGDNFAGLKNHLHKLVYHAERNKIYRWVRQNTAMFLFLETIMTNDSNAKEILKNPQAFNEHLVSIAAEKYQQTRKAIRRGIIQSIVYIFFTKMVVALLIEYPYERYIAKDINSLAIAINLIFPPSLMLLMGMSVKAPEDDNTKVIVSRLDSMLYSKEIQPPTLVRFDFSDTRQRWALAFNAVYAYLFVIICLLVGYSLMDFFHFNLISLGLFFMFLSLIMLFGFRLRWQSEELLVIKPRRGFLGNIFSILTMPFVNLGVWLSSTISKVNVITFLLDKIIDAPLKSGINSAEEWSKFISDRRVEAVEIPRD